jgi:hypothetical protein
VWIEIEWNEKGEEMEHKLRTTCVLALSLCVAPAVMLAHHGSALYESSKRITFQAVVTDWLWASPHCLLEFDVKDDKGNTVHWNAEVSNPQDMTAQGWSRKMFKPGDQVTLTLIPAKNGQPIGRILEVVLNGKTYAGFGTRPPASGSTPPENSKQ